MYCCGAIRAEHPLMQPFVLQLDGTVENMMGMPGSSQRNSLSGCDDRHADPPSPMQKSSSLSDRPRLAKPI